MFSAQTLDAFIHNFMTFLAFHVFIMLQLTVVQIHTTQTYQIKSNQIIYLVKQIQRHWQNE